MKKKILIINIIVLLVVMSFLGTVSNAAEAKIELVTSKSEYSKGDEITIEVKVSSITHEKGIIGLGAVLDYNKDELEYVKMTGSGNWSNPMFNADNGKLVTDRNDLTKEDETICQIIFKVKVDNVKTSKITLKDIEVSGGDGALKLSETSKTINIKAVSSGNDGNNGGNNDGGNNNGGNNNDGNNNGGSNNGGNSNGGSNNGGNNTNTNNTNNSIKNNVGSATNTIVANKVSDNTSKNKIPNAGVGRPVVIIFISVMIIAAFIALIKYKNLK